MLADMILNNELYVPMKAKEIAMLLDIPKAKRSELMEVLDSLVADGTIGVSKKGKYMKPENVALVGTFESTSRGFGFVVIPDREDDIFVKANDTMNAFYHDKVKVVITTEKNGGKRAEGKIVAIVEHEVKEVVGTFQKNRTYGFVIPDNAKIAKLVENYRRALIMHTYQEELVNQKLANEISDEEISAYYEKNKELFHTEHPFVKGLFIKVPLHSQDLASVRKWYKKNNRDAIESLEKYSLRNAVSYDYFYDRWMPLSDIAVKIPLKALDTDENYLDKNRNIEVKDTAFCYFLHVEEFLGKDQQRPLDFAKTEIKEILINLKRVEFINKVKEELYRHASDRNKINYYYLNSNE